MSVPLVSVIIPAFNCERFISQAVDSALAQDYPALEVIVVDDGSVDGTASILKGYASRIRFLQQPNRGCAAARNVGLQHAQGFYVAFLDADDVWLRSKLTYQVQALLEAGMKLAYSRFIDWRPDENDQYMDADLAFAMHDHPGLSTCTLITGDVLAPLLLECIVWTSTVLVERRALQQAGCFDETLVVGEDYDLWLRLAARLPMLGLDRPTALYRHHAGSITRKVHDLNYERIVIERALVAGKEHIGNGKSLPPALRSRLAGSAFSYGYNHTRAGNHRQAAEGYREAMQLSPVSPRLMLRYVLACIRARLSRVRHAGE